MPADDDEHVVFLQETEPNDTSGDAMSLGAAGAYSFQGVCRKDESQDWYVGTARSGEIDASLYVSLSPPRPPEGWEPEESDVEPIATISLKTASLSDIVPSTPVSPDKPLVVSGQVASAGDVYVRIGCPTGRTLWYSAVVYIP